MFTWNNPVKLVFGAGSIKGLVRESMPGTKAMILTSNGTSAEKTGALAVVTEALGELDVPYAIYNGIESNPTTAVLMEGVEITRAEACDFVIGLGGGSVLDAATIIAAMAPQKEGTVWDYVRGGTGGGQKLEEKSLPYIAITTCAGTGSEVDSWGVVSNPETNEKISFAGSYADLAIVDPQLMTTVPATFTAYQGFDALLHNIEGYLSRFSNEMSNMICLEGVQNASGALALAVADGENVEARTKMAMADVLGGYAMEISSNTSEHAIEHAMSGHHPELPHGAGLLMICEAYFKHMIERHTMDDRFVALAKAMGRKHAKRAEEFLEALGELKSACKVADLKMSDYGIVPEEFETFVADAKRTMRSLFMCDRVRMKDEEFVEILKESFR